jgi:hypothetical protein
LDSDESYPAKEFLKGRQKKTCLSQKMPSKNNLLAG